MVYKVRPLLFQFHLYIDKYKLLNSVNMFIVQTFPTVGDSTQGGSGYGREILTTAHKTNTILSYNSEV